MPRLSLVLLITVGILSDKVQFQLLKTPKDVDDRSWSVELLSFFIFGVILHFNCLLWKIMKWDFRFNDNLLILANSTLCQVHNLLTQSKNQDFWDIQLNWYHAKSIYFKEVDELTIWSVETNWVLADKQ